MHPEQPNVKIEIEKHEDIKISIPPVEVKSEHLVLEVNVDFPAEASDNEKHFEGAYDLKPQDEEITDKSRGKVGSTVKVELPVDELIAGGSAEKAVPSGSRKSSRAKKNVNYSVFDDGSEEISEFNPRISKKGNSMGVNPKWRLKKERHEMRQLGLSAKVENPEIAGSVNERIKQEKCAEEPLESVDVVSAKIKVECGTLDSKGAVEEGCAAFPGQRHDGGSLKSIGYEQRTGDVKVEDADFEPQDEIVTPHFPPRYGRIKVNPEDLIEDLTSDGKWTGKLAELKSQLKLDDPSTLSVTDGQWFICLVCKYRTHLSSAIVKHIRIHTGEKPYVCNECDYRCAESSSLSSHKRTHTGEKPYACELCDFRSRSSNQIKFHMMAHQGVKPLKCSECGYRCIEPGGMKTHMMTHTGEKPYACSHCDYRGIKGSSLKSHMRVHTGDKPYQCSFCTFVCSNASSLKLHTRTHTGEKPYKCEHCDHQSASASSMKVHMRRHTGERPYVCEVCGQKSASQGRHASHMRTHTGEKSHACPYCDHKTARADNLKVHIMTHTGEKPYACDLCNYACSEKARIKSHMRVHSGEKPFECSVCGLRTADPNGLKSHMRVHTGERPYACKLCDFRTTRPMTLKNHEMRHTGLKPFVCPYCPHRARKSCVMKAHVATHTNNGKFICLFTGCDYRAATAANLRSHSVVHSADKPYKCHLCSYKGKQDSQLKMHMKRYHRVNVRAPLFNCAHCTFHTFCRSLMKEHAVEHFQPTERVSGEAEIGESVPTV